MTDAAHESPSVAAREQRGRKVARHRKAVSGALIVLTLAVAAVCVMLLTSTLTQSRVSGIVINGVSINIQKLDDMRVQWNDLRAQMKALNAANQQLREDTAAYDEFYKRFKRSQANINDMLNKFAEKVKQKDPGIGAAFLDYNHFSPVERVEFVKEARDFITRNYPELKDEMESVISAGGVYAQTDDAERLRWNKTLDEDRSKINSMSTEDLINSNMDKLFNTSVGALKIEPADRDRIENAFYDMYSRMWGGEILNYLIVMPQDILTLALVIGMGVLGSVLQMTHALFVNKRQVETVGAYFLRMTVGAITALVIFIVTKAGLPVLADPSKLGGEAPVNPFFISFVAIISGLMSENAILFVEAQGEKLFATNAEHETPRWMRKDFSEKFKEAGRNVEALSALLGVTPEQVKDWVAGHAAMPERVQTVLAGVAGLSPREIFTDIAPRP